MSASRAAARTVARSRARHRLSGPALGFEQSTDHEIADEVTIVDVTLPRTVDPGEEIDAVVEVETNAPPPVFQVGPIAPPDKCLTDGLNPEIGWLMETTLTLGDDSDSGTACKSSGRARAPNVVEYDLSVTAPTEPGSYDYEVTVAGANTGDVMDVEFVPLTVRDPDPDPDPDPDLPSPGLLQQLLNALRGALSGLGSGILSAIEEVTDLINRIIDWFVERGRAIIAALRDLAAWLGDNPLLLAAVGLAAFVVVPRVAGKVFSLTPIGRVLGLVS